MKEAAVSWAKDWSQKDHRAWIMGEWIASEGEDSLTLTEPATLKAIATYRFCSLEQLDAAVSGASRVFQEGLWHQKTSMRQRARIMRSIGQLIREHQGELATLEALNNGKTYREAFEDDLPDCADIFDYYSGWIDKIYGDSVPVEAGLLNYTSREPLGVVGLIVPWNFPLLMACWKLAPALACGNSLVIKPSEHTPLSLIRLFELISEKIDLPPGLVNLVLGGGKLGDAMARHPGMAKISFTGSTEVGKKIVGASSQSNLKHVSLELGGKSPNIFFADTPNLQEAIDHSFTVMFSHKGEKCSEPTRFYIEKSIYSQVVDQLVALCNQTRCGPSFAEGVDQGAQCHLAHFNKVKSYLTVGRQDGAKLLCGGEVDPLHHETGGYFVRPTIFGDVTPDMRLSREEIFGPILAVKSFDSESEAIQLANSSDYGLAAGVYTADLSRGHRVASQLEAGMVFVNRYGCYEFSSPFGGFKQSGWGKDMAHHSIDSYTKTKSIWVHVNHGSPS